MPSKPSACRLLKGGSGMHLLFDSTMVSDGPGLYEINTNCEKDDSVVHDNEGAAGGTVEERV